MIHKFPRFVLLVITILFIGTIGTLRHLHATSVGVSQNLWILLGIEMGFFLSICLCAFRETALLHRKILRQNEMLQHMAHHDDLTHCLNRRALFEILHDWENKQEESPVISCLMIDIDHFKQVNDQFGHANGDAILKQVVEILDQQLQGIAAPLTRYGGEEFCVVLQGYSVEEAQIIAERLRSAIEIASKNHKLKVQPLPASEATGKETVRPFHEVASNEPKRKAIPQVSLPLSISIGIASWSGVPLKRITTDQLLSEADQTLYQAKRAGRNTICSLSIGNQDEK